MSATAISSDDARLRERQALMRPVQFTSEEAGEALGNSESLVRELTLCGELPCRWTGRLVRYTASELQALFRACDARFLERQAGMPRVLFTAEETAQSLAISESLIRQLTLFAELPCKRIGRLVRYTASDLEEFVYRFDSPGYSSSG